MKKIYMEVVSTEEKIFSGDINFAVIPTVTGPVGIYPNHIPIMNIVTAGVLRLQVIDPAEEIIVAVSGGLLEVRQNKIIVLADVVIRSTEMDQQRAQQAKLQAQNQLKLANDDKSLATAKVALAIAIAQLKTLDYLKYKKKL